MISNKAVAYLRVSTEKQGQSKIGLAGQAVGIEAFALSMELDLVQTYRDVATGMGPNTLKKRDGLRAAIAHAKQTGVPIVVYDLSRLSRDVPTLGEILREGVEVLSATEDLALHAGRMEARVARAQLEGEAISRSTKAALQQLKASGVKLGNKTNLPVAGKLGAGANKLRQDAKVEQIASFLRQHPELVKAEEVMNLLNQAGILSGRNKPWTLAGVRRPLRQARAHSLVHVSGQSEVEDHYSKNPEFGRF